MRPDVEVVVEASDHALEHGIVTYQPIQWEQRRQEVRGAMVAHRWASLKLRQLSRQQWAINWETMPGTQLWRWARRIGTMILGGD